MNSDPLGKHNRSIPILGREGHERLADSVVVIAGVGAIGSILFEIMVRQGIGLVIVIDPDLAVESHNLDRQFLYRERDLGKPKATAAKEAAKEINEDVEVVPYVGTFSNAINSSLRELVSSADLIVSAIDNRLGRYSVSRFAYTHGIPHLDGATGEFNCRAYIFPHPHKGPCYLCTLTKKDYEEISKVFSCTRKTDNDSIAPAITETGVQVANVLAIEAIRLLLGMPTRYNEIRMNLYDWNLFAENIETSSGHSNGHI